MAYLIESIDINPHDDYPEFIDFAYHSLDRLVSGEELQAIFKDIPNGFQEWLVNNAKKAGYAMALDQKE
jgi:hypothetical protein